MSPRIWKIIWGGTFVCVRRVGFGLIFRHSFHLQNVALAPLQLTILVRRNRPFVYCMSWWCRLFFLDHLSYCISLCEGKLLIEAQANSSSMLIELSCCARSKLVSLVVVHDSWLMRLLIEISFSLLVVCIAMILVLKITYWE